MARDPVMTSAGKDRQLSLFGSNDSNEPSDADELALAELEVEELASVAFEPEDLVDDIDEDDLDDEDRDCLLYTSAKKSILFTEMQKSNAPEI